MSYFGPIEPINFLWVALFRGGASLLVFFVDPFSAIFYEAFMEKTDFILAVCADGATELEYGRFDKIFDALMIAIYMLWMRTVKWNKPSVRLLGSDAGVEYKRNWFWVRPIFYLAALRLVGIGVFMATDNFLFIALFMNVWLLYFTVFTGLARLGLLHRLRRKRFWWYALIVVIALYKFGEEIFHHVVDAGGVDRFGLQCADTYRTDSKRAAVRTIVVFSLALVPIVVMNIVTRCMRRCRQLQRGW